MSETRSFDVVVVGGGILGMATAMALVGRGRSVVVLEAEERPAVHQTGHNSGVIHSGLYYKPGSLKARTCREGRLAMYEFCAEEGIPHRRCGKVVVAMAEAELPRLDELERRGRANGLEGIERLDERGIREVEPHAAGIAGLRVPETGVVDYRRVTAAYGRRVEAGGGEVRCGARVVAARRRGGGLEVETAGGGRVSCGLLVNCAGLQSDRVARLCGVEPGVRIVPFRGEYWHLAAERAHLCRALIYPVPDPEFPFLGVHLTRGVDDEVEAGPNAVLAFHRHGYEVGRFSSRDTLSTLTYPGFWRLALRFWRVGVSEMGRSWSREAFARALGRLVPEIRAEDLTRGGSGIRAQAVDARGRLVDDFHVARAPGMVHVLNAPSPGATASIAIGRRIAEMVEEAEAGG